MAAGGLRPLAGRRIVLTGASRGIGRAAALRLARAGAQVLAVARDAQALTSLAFEAKPAAGRIFAHSCDLASEEEIEALADAAARRLGGVDALVNNAGAGVFRELEALAPGEFEATLAVCLKAPFLLIRALAPYLEASGGEVVNVSSICAVTGFPGAAAYCAAKAGLEGMSRALAEELRPRGIRLSVLRPGATATSMWKDIPGEFDTERMIPPDLVAESLEFLLSQSRRVWTETMVILPPAGRV
ncbi:MAG: SDR family oxidoreductase [Candidatus Tectomicrobia bacterium]|uniref:SDR family oxidoreductase n=1 Tax=Tectimicrobiota bacterium TaxID=2528274 RepID=A0A932MM36_UNCTE|nr:SDR family oxidoreductase [Candidatus Tectomicrobia bacterium]